MNTKAIFYLENVKPKLEAFYYLRGLEMIQTLGGNNNGFRAGYVERDFTAEETFEALCWKLLPEADPVRAEEMKTDLMTSGADMVRRIVERLTEQTHETPANYRGLFYADGGEYRVRFRTSVFQSPYYRKTIKNSLAAVAHRFGVKLPDVNGRDSWRLLLPDGDVTDMTFKQWKAIERRFITNIMNDKDVKIVGVGPCWKDDPVSAFVDRSYIIGPDVPGYILPTDAEEAKAIIADAEESGFIDWIGPLNSIE